MRLAELKDTPFDVRSTISKLTADLAKLEIKNPSFTVGFCFHAGARIHDALKLEFPSHTLEIQHDGGHIAVYDLTADMSYDARGGKAGEGSILGNRPQHRWKNSETFVKWLKKNRDSLGAESIKGLEVL